MPGLGFQFRLVEPQVRGWRNRLNRKARRRVVDHTEQALVKTGIYLLQEVRRGASGRPGPDVVTGAYRNSWTLRGVRRRGTFMRMEVFTRHPAARRLEFGFHGEDSLGRRYNQPPFPHFRPAVARAYAYYGEQLNDAIVKSLS